LILFAINPAGRNTRFTGHHLKPPAAMHVAVAGNIGSGKTTLTNLLARQFKWEPHYESVDENPYLNDFYEDMQRWSFNVQIFFLNTRFNQLVKIVKSGKKVIQDRTIYEDAYIFAPNLHAMGLMTTRDYNTYLNLFNLMTQLISPPDLLIYLRGSVPALVNQIEKRGRPYENSIRIDYLKRLNERYEGWISQYELGKLLVVDIDEMNFAENNEQLGEIVSRVQGELHGLFK
jgi:deoxyadenosine/deoxycytidine kinase